MAGDWLKMHRKIIESQAFSDPAIFRLWCYLLCRANYRVSYFRGERIEVGQLAFSHRHLAGSLGVSHGALGRYLAKLQSWGNITVQSGRSFSVLTICNWETYQSSNEFDRGANGARIEAPEEAPENAGSGARNGARVGTPVGRKPGADRDVPKKERIKEGKKLKTPLPPTPPEFELPASVRSEPLAAAVADWLAYKAERREGYKPTGLKSFVTHLANSVKRHGEAEIIRRLQKAMAQNWKGWDFGDEPRPGARRGDFHSGPGHLFDPHSETRNEI